MSETFVYEPTVIPNWIDYNGHMRDAYYGLIFSLAVDAMQDEVGFDEAYRNSTGCTIYLLEDHKYFLKEVGPGVRLPIETVVLGTDNKRFHLHLRMLHEGTAVAIGEFLELHVNQHPEPHATPMPDEIAQRLMKAQFSKKGLIEFRSREMNLRRNSA